MRKLRRWMLKNMLKTCWKCVESHVENFFDFRRLLKTCWKLVNKLWKRLLKHNWFNQLAKVFNKLLKVLCWNCWKSFWLIIFTCNFSHRTAIKSTSNFSTLKSWIVENLLKTFLPEKFSTLSTLKVVENRLHFGNKLFVFTNSPLTAVNFQHFFNNCNVENYLKRLYIAI